MESALKQIKLDLTEQALIANIQNGLPISDRPYQELGQKLNLSEEQVASRISDLHERGLFKRFGVVVRHHELGYRENAMVVWNIPDQDVDNFAKQIKSYPFITLCYRRARQLPEWSYNLYCMIHGKSRENVKQLLNGMINENQWQDIPQEVLFSKRRFKQTAANYLTASGK